MALPMKLALLLALASIVVVIFRLACSNRVARSVWAVAPLVAVLATLIACAFECFHPCGNLSLCMMSCSVSSVTLGGLFMFVSPHTYSSLVISSSGNMLFP